MRLFEIPFQNAFSAEAVLLHKAQQEEDYEKVEALQARMSMNTSKSLPNYYEDKEGEEKKHIIDRARIEDVCMRALLEIPQYWVGYLGSLDDTDRVRRILQKQDPQKMAEMGIDLSQDDDHIKSSLQHLAAHRELPPEKKWLGEEWPEGVLQKFQDFVKN